MTITQSENQFIKAIAIGLVIIAHIISNYFSSWVRFDHYYISIMGIEAVFLFLFLSGYGLKKSFNKNHLVDYWEKKIQKVFFPYWIITLIYVVLFVRSIKPEKLLLNMLCIDFTRSIDGTMWYLSFYLLWIVAFYCLFKVNIPMWFKILLLFVLGWFFSKYQGDWFDVCTWQFNRNAYAFPLGVLLAHIDTRLPIHPRMNSKFKTILFLALLLSIIAIVRAKKDTCLFFSLIGCILILAIHTIFSVIQSFGFVSIIKRVGENSYLLYLLEGKFFAIINAIVPLETKPAIKLITFFLLCSASVFVKHTLEKSNKIKLGYKRIGG